MPIAIAIVLSMLITLVSIFFEPKANDTSDDVIATPATCECDACEWDEYYGEAYSEYYDEFTALFNAIEYKRSKNGRSMVRRPGDKSFKFVAKGK